MPWYAVADFKNFKKGKTLSIKVFLESISYWSSDIYNVFVLLGRQLVTRSALVCFGIRYNAV